MPATSPALAENHFKGHAATPVRSSLLEKNGQPAEAQAPPALSPHSLESLNTSLAFRR